MPTITYQYYYKRNECKAKTSQDANCICWHDEGTGPFRNHKHNDETPLIKWRVKPSTTIIRKFIGGPLDGQRVTLDSQTLMPISNDISVVQYKMITLEGSVYVHQVMADSEMNTDEVLQKLIDGYKP